MNKHELLEVRGHERRRKERAEGVIERLRAAAERLEGEISGR